MFVFFSIVHIPPALFYKPRHFHSYGVEVIGGFLDKFFVFGFDGIHHVSGVALYFKQCQCGVVVAILLGIFQLGAEDAFAVFEVHFVVGLVGGAVLVAPVDGCDVVQVVYLGQGKEIQCHGKGTVTAGFCVGQALVV